MVITGLSGSGASRRSPSTRFTPRASAYVESLSAYARQFLEQMEKPDVDLIDGLSPAISIERRRPGRIRARLSAPSPKSTTTSASSSPTSAPARIAGRRSPASLRAHRRHVVMLYPQDERLNVLAPVVRGRKGEFKKERRRCEGGDSPSPDRWTVPGARGEHRARSPEEPFDRRRRRSPDRAWRHRAPVDRLDRDGAQSGRRHRHRQHAGRRGSAVLAPAGVRGLRAEHARDDAAGILVQLPPHGAARTAGAWARRWISIRSGLCPTNRKPLAGGAIAPWARGDKKLVRTRCSCRDDYGVDLEAPFAAAAQAARC